MHYLLDTNILSESAKPQPNPNVLRMIERYRTEICTASPVWNELLFGWLRLPHSKRRTKLQEYTLRVLKPALDILPYDVDAAAWHARERARLGSIGRTPAFIDGQIAAVARINRLVLVTGNVSDFNDFEGLVIEDWGTELEPT